MAARSIPLPPKKVLLAAARKCAARGEPSRANVARAIGWQPSTLNMKLRRKENEALRKELDALLVPQAVGAESKDEVSEVEVLRQRVRELELQAKRDRKEKVYEERITAAVEEAAASRKSVYSPQAVPKSKRSKTKHEFAFQWSDLHAGEVVSLEETGGMNSYDWQTMLKRHDKLRESLFSYQDNRSYPVETLHVFALGDMLSGNIHDELVATNEIPMAEAVVQLGEDGAEWLESLTERFPRIHVSGVVGNHPRAHKKPWAKQGYDNADWSAYRIMEAVLKRNPRISFDIPKANQHRVRIAQNWYALLWHSDGVRSTMPGVPWGGIIRRVTNLRNQYAAAGQPCQYFCSGHFHTANAVEGGEIVVNGSVKGVDEYTLKAFGGARPPQQVLLTFHPKNGLTDASFLDCP